MSEQNKKLVLRWYDEVWNNSDENAIDEMMHPEGNAFGLGAEPLIGPDGFKPFYKAFNDAYKDINVTADRLFTDGEYVISLCTVKAVHKESGNPVNFTGTAITLMENGQIKQAWNHFDFLTLNLQNGKIKEEQLR